jgi:hypothetical protein
MMEKSAPFTDDTGDASVVTGGAVPQVALTPRQCKCGRGPWRKGQRNCVFCNREANARYRESLRREEEALGAFNLPLFKNDHHGRA